MASPNTVVARGVSPRTRLRVGGRVGDAGGRKGIAPLAALAAQAAMERRGAVNRVHARKRQLERDAQSRAEPNHVFLVHQSNGVAIIDRVIEPERERCAIAAKNSGVASGNGLPASGPSAMRDPASRGDDARFGQQHQVAAGK